MVPRQPRPTKVAPFQAFLRQRVEAYPELTVARLHREIGELGYRGGGGGGRGGGQTAVKEFLPRGPASPGARLRSALRDAARPPGPS